MRFGKLYLILLISLMFSIIMVSAVSAVDSVEVSNYSELSGNVSAGNSVVLKNNITDGYFGDGIVISKSVAVDGNGFCIDANQSGTIFHINNASAVLTLKNITLKNGKLEGGAIRGGNVNLNCIGNVLFINNDGGINGGAILVDSVNINCTDGNISFINNNCKANGGAIYAVTGSVVINCTNGNIIFHNNNVFVEHENNMGGAICANGGVVINCTNGDIIFYNNKGKGFSWSQGGAIFANGGVVINCINGNIIFTNNTVVNEDLSFSFGGAICTFREVVINCINGNVTFYNNTGGSGGAISGSTVINCTGNVIFQNNTAGRGGAISGGAVINCTCNIIFQNNTAKGLGSESNGGAILGDAVINCTGNVIFQNNTATGYGGAIYTWGSVNINNAIFYGNNATNGTAITLYDWTNSNLTHCFWGLNYKNKTSIINSNLIATINDDGEINGTVAPDNWILLNITSPIEVIKDINNTFQLQFNILTNGTENQTYNKFNSTMLVKLNITTGTIQEYAIAGKSFNYIPNTRNKFTINVYNLNDEFITNITIDKVFLNNFVYIYDELNENQTGGNITIRLHSNATGKVNVTINGTKHDNLNLENGTVKIYLSDLKVGTYNITVIYKNDGNYASVNKNLTLNVYFINGTGELYYDIPSGCVNITLPSDANGNITIKIKGKYYNTTVVNGLAIFNNVTELKVGNNTINVNYTGDVKYNDKICDINVTVSKLVPYINITGKLNIENIGGNITINLPKDANGNITLTINNTSYNSTVVNGSVIFENVKELIAGNNIVNIIYFNDIKYNDTDRNITFKVEPNVKTFKDLQDLINENSSVILAYNYTYDLTKDNGSIIINRNTIIDGDGYTIDGKNLVNIFKINKNCKLVLKNVKLINALMYSIINEGTLDINNVTSKAPIYNKGIITSGVKFIVYPNKVTTYDSFLVSLRTDNGIPIAVNSLKYSDDQGHNYESYIYYNGYYVNYVPEGITGHVTFNNVKLNSFTNLTSKGSLDITKYPKTVLNSVIKNTNEIIKDLVPVVKNTFKSNKEITNVVSTVKNIVTKSTMDLNTILKSFNNKVMSFI